MDDRLDEFGLLLALLVDDASLCLDREPLVVLRRLFPDESICERRFKLFIIMPGMVIIGGNGCIAAKRERILRKECFCGEMMINSKLLVVLC